MSTIKKTISIDEQVVKKASDLHENFSAVVEAALREYLKRHSREKALKSFGKWERDRTECSAHFIKELRKEDNREFINLSKSKKKKK